MQKFQSICQILECKLIKLVVVIVNSDLQALVCSTLRGKEMVLKGSQKGSCFEPFLIRKHSVVQLYLDLQGFPKRDNQKGSKYKTCSSFSVSQSYLEGFQVIDQIGDAVPPGLSIFTFSSPFLFLMLTTPLIMPRARYWPSFVQLRPQINNRTQTI